MTANIYVFYTAQAQQPENQSQEVNSQKAEDEVQVTPNVVYGVPDGIQMNANMAYNSKPQPETEHSYDYIIN